MSAIASLRKLLPRIKPEAARVQTALLAALDGLSIEGGRAMARAEPRPPAGGWLACSGSSGVILLRLGVADPLGAVAELGAREGAIVAIERALNLEFVPTAVVERVAPDAAAIRLDLPLGPVWLAASWGIELAPLARTRHVEPWAAALPVVLEASLFLPGLDRANLDMLNTGDLLLCPADARARVVVGGRPFAARLLPSPTWLSLALQVFSGDHPMTETVSEIAPGGALDLVITLELALEPLTLPYSQAASLAPGSVLDLGRAGVSLAVAVQAGRLTIATGDLVALGKGYGVIIRERSD